MFIRSILTLLAAQLMFAAAVTYSYDPAGRLIKADYGAAGSITYTYDKAGNLLSRSVVSGSTAGGDDYLGQHGELARLGRHRR